MTNQLFDLPILKQISPCISQCQIDELPLLIISHPKFRAALTFQGAHLLAFQPTGEQPILWLSNQSAFKSGTAIRGGIPICWPWFGPAGKPSHGFARNLPWELTTHSEDATNVNLTLTLRDNEETRKYWPNAFTLVVNFKLGTECKIELGSHGDFETTSALHAYFQIGDINHVSVAGLGKPYVDKVLNGQHAEQEGNLIFSGQTDRIYTQPEDHSRIHDPILKRTIELYHQYNSDVVAWNPGAELSASMKDMTNDGYKTMVCVETAAISQPQKNTPRCSARLALTLGTAKTNK